MATNGEITKGIGTLYDTINRIIEEARAAVYRTHRQYYDGQGILAYRQSNRRRRTKGKRKGGIWQTSSQTIIPKTD